MKRKLALMLAGVMMLASVPMNLSAANASVSLRGNTSSSADYTLFYEYGWLEQNTNQLSGQVSGRSGTLEYYTNGMDLVITANDTISGNSNGNLVATLTLENAEWFYRNRAAVNVPVTEAEWDITDPAYREATTASGYTPVIGGATSDPYLIDAKNSLTTPVARTINPQAVPSNILPSDFGVTYFPEILEGATPSLVGNYIASIAADIDGGGTGKPLALEDYMYQITPGTADWVQITPYDGNSRGASYSGTGLPTRGYTEFNSAHVTTIGGNDYIAATGYVRELEGDVVAQSNESGSYVSLTKGAYVYDLVQAPAALAPVIETMENSVPATVNRTAGYPVIDEDAVFNLVTTNDPLDTTYDPANGILNVRNGKATYYRFGDTAQTNYNEAQYYLEFSDVDESVAHLYMLEDARGSTGTGGHQVIIPLVILTTEEDQNVSVLIEPANNAPIQRNSYSLAVATEGNTNTYAADLRRSRNEFNLYDIIISERRAATIHNGKFELIAPSGYEWDAKGLTVHAETNLSWTNSNTGQGIQGSDWDWAYRTSTSTNRTVNQQYLEITLSGVSRSSVSTGKIYLRGLKLMSEDYDDSDVAEKALYARIRDITPGTGDTNISTQTFQVATEASYTLVLTRLSTEVPELVSGRLESFSRRVSGNTWEEYDSINDDYHYAGKVRIRESLADSWWGTSRTTLTLPEGVQYLKVEFDNLSNIASGGLVGNELVSYYNTHRRIDSFVEINDNNMTLTSLTTGTGRARIDMDIWVNLEVDFEGDIDVTLSEYSVRTGSNDDQTVTIATAIVPVEVETTITDVKIGYQHVPVADFEITETKAGNLLRGKEVYVSVSDLIYTDLAIAPGFKYEVTDGNLKISNVRTGSYLGSNVGQGAHLRYTIDRVSTEASTVKFSNVEVKIDRTVPYSNPNTEEDRGIKLVAWGPAIAENYEGLWGDGYYNSSSDVVPNGGTTVLNVSYDFFSTPGIVASYVNVTSSPSGTDTNFTNVVKVTIGNPTALVNDEEFTMPVAAYVSEASNSTMIPVRFVSYALGLDENAVIWDGINGTVTVDGGSRTVQFEVGKATYRYNGMDVPMLSPDGLQVACEIREERAFVPFRGLAEAFGITVGWNGDTNTATYNAPEDQ